MRLPDPPRRTPAESIVPMINVVFLLLIFFLMTAQIAPPDEIGAAPPETGDAAAPSPSTAGATLIIGRDGAIAYGEARGDAALVAAGRAASKDPGVADGATADLVSVRADADLDAEALAKALRRLAEEGATQVELVVLPR